jgi:hypothetical protein
MVLGIPILGRLLAAAAALTVVLGMVSQAEAETNVGDMARVQQTVYGTSPNGQQLAKHQGDGVVFQESIETWDSSSAQLRFIDGSHLSLGPKAKVLIDEFVFDPAQTQGNALIKISAGTLRWITGAMPKGQTVIKTPTATLTLRGTDVTVHVHPDGVTDTTVHEGIVDNHNDLTNTGTTLGPGDSQTSDQDGNHPNDGDTPGDLGDQGGQAGNGGNTPEQRRTGVLQADTKPTKPTEPASSEQPHEPPCDCE